MTGLVQAAPATAGVALAMVLVAGLAGCREIDESAAPVHEPAKVGTIDGAAAQRVVLDREAAEQVSLMSASVVRVGSMLVVPYAALIYDEHGTVWVYTTREPLTYLREAVVVDRVEGDRAWLDRGPASGTTVVTVGAAELYGAELGIAGGH